ncbi:MAG: hypothetical protein Q9217_005707, partial [Psora testacea]
MANRKERRAQAQAQAQAQIKPKGSEIPFSQAPAYGEPAQRKTKTLLEIAEELQLQQLLANNQRTSSASAAPVPTTRIDPTGSPKPRNTEPSSSSPPPPPPPLLSLADTVLYTLSLTLLHFTLTVLIQHQYASTPPQLSTILWSSSIASPTPLLILVLVALLHPRSGQAATQGLFLVLGVGAGT